MAESQYFLLIILGLALGDPILEDPNLLKTHSSNIFITLTQSLDSIYSQIESKTYSSRGAKITALYKTLKASTSEWHAPIIQGLQKFTGVQVKSYWITNQIYVKHANPSVLNYLLAQPSVKSVAEELVIPINHNGSRKFAESEPDWDIKQSGCDKVWKESKGKNVYIGFIDTGALGTHQSIEGNYAGTEEGYAWFDAVKGEIEPYDDVGQGTGVISVALGVNGIGCAPESQWMACKACTTDGCEQNHLVTCGEYMACPTQEDGSNEDCDYAPFIVHGTFSIYKKTTFYDDVIKAWKAAFIVPVFSIGDKGPKCKTSGYPGNHPDVIGVGSTNREDKLSEFSSRGPKPIADGQVTPLIVAPGEEIAAAGIASNDEFVTESGTAFASPHVAGALALILADKKARYADTKQLKKYILPTAEKNLPPTGHSKCGKHDDQTFPNDMYGHGRINATAAFKKMKNS